MFNKINIVFFVLILACILFMSAGSFSQEEQGVLTVALTGKYPPFSFFSAEGDLVGFDVDVSREIAQRLDMEPEIITTEWDGILAGLLAGRYDAIIGSMAITPERAQKVNFSRAYYVSGAQLFIHEEDSDEIKSIEDMKGKTVGVVLGTTFERFLDQNFPSIKIQTYKSDVDIFQEMKNRRLDGFVSDRLVGLYQIKRAGTPFVPAGHLLYEEKMGIPVEKDRAKLLNDINFALIDMEEDGTLEELNEKWFGKGQVAQEISGTAMQTDTIVSKLGKGFGITLLVAALSLFFGFAMALPTGVILNRNKGLLYSVLRLVVDFLRGTPVLIQLFFVYFSAPQIGIRLSPLQSAIITLSVNAAAYMSEVIRSGLMAVPQGQKRAARALGLSKFQIFRYVVWPQAFRVAIPPLMNSAVALMKDTALISVIAVPEVIREAQSIISVTYDPMKYYFIVAVMFFIFTFPMMKLADRLEKKIKQKGFKNA